MGTLTYSGRHNRKGTLKPDPEMWEALNFGAGLQNIMNDFYDRVYEDSYLLPFFESTEKQRLIEKQYSFMRSIFTGEKLYFGDHPKNAHHWMVISNKLFDYREELMEQCLRRYGLEEKLINRWRKIEEVFRRAIVKDHPVPKMIDGKPKPFDGYSEIDLDEATLCDKCGSEINSGTLVHYHVRTGKVYCEKCMDDIDAEDMCYRATQTSVQSG